ncbi:MAG: nucleoside triphosphate pyrophosphohydrolase [Gemmatimonadales bacterium]|nr:nucleoside triphosphate pyrophosphohydrolase [Gemmatimonadales bacterium]
MAEHFEDLLATIRTLRAPGGCAWDRKQNLVSASRYLMDEAGELVESALAEDSTGVREELADLLFMTCFCCEILGETHPLTMHDIAHQGNEKLIRRHPHVFGDPREHDLEQSQERWNEIKNQEKRARGIEPNTQSALKDLPASTAPLHQAHDYQKDAAGCGFEWPDITGVWAKLNEEIGELSSAIESGNSSEMEHEIGDLLFTVVNLSRWLKIQPDMALRKANTRFRTRFHLVEKEFQEKNHTLKNAPITDLEASWQRAKAILSDQSDPEEPGSGKGVGG